LPQSYILSVAPTREAAFVPLFNIGQNLL